jgi:DNA ligase-1
LNELKNSAAENNCKGIILKKKNSEYDNKNNWLSIDADKYSINGILLYAQKDLNSDFYSEFTFGVWNNDELITFTKTRALLNSDEITEIKAFIKDNTLEKFGPVRTVKPELVFEILFDGISVSSRHKSGITLRNPQIHKWHKDKKSHEAGHLLHLKELLNAGK